MDQELTRLEYPIDVMYLIHKALRGEARRAERQARDVEVGCSLQPFTLAFTAWATALVYHAEKELGTQLSSFADSVQVSPDDPIERVKWAMVANEDDEHNRLLEGVQEVMTVLEEDIGASSVISRTKQHLASQVIALRIAQEDHLETEEVMVLPLVRERLAVKHQLDVVAGLLIDDQAQDQRWLIDWISQDLTQGEQRLLTELEEQIKERRTALR